MSLYSRIGFLIELITFTFPSVSALLLNLPCFLKAREQNDSQVLRSMSRETDEVTLENGRQAADIKSRK